MLLVQLAGGCSREAPAPVQTKQAVENAMPGPAEAADERLVLVFGDSLYAGYNLDQDKGFAPVLEDALGKAGIKARVVNGGVSGDTSAAGLGRLAFTLDGLPRKPDLVLVGLGGNDMLRGLEPQTTRANLDAILTELKKRRIPAMLTGMLASPNMGQDFANAFNSLYPDLAKQYRVPLYPFFLDGVIGNPALLLPDGVHPNDRGVQAITERVAPTVAKRLEELAA
jgi:acyl-CoA thioesterase-1